MAARTLLAVLTVAFLMTATAWAAVPQSLSYQGYLTDRIGNPITDSQTITFSIYTVPVNGAPVWQETKSVAFANGLFSVWLGESIAFPPDLFNVPLYLGIIIGTDSEMEPRRPLTTAGFSFRAEDADALQGRVAAELDQSSHVDDDGNPHAVTAGQTGAATLADVAGLQSQLDAALAIISQLQTDLASETTNRIAADNAEEAARIADVDAEQAGRIDADNFLSTTIAEIQANTVLALDGILTYPDSATALFTGVNVQVVNGTETTGGVPNGVGNLIIGYDTVDGDDPICSIGANDLLGPLDSQSKCDGAGALWASSHKSGSHNVVIGDQHNYSRYSGLVVGYNNSITGSRSSVSGGEGNTASGDASSVTGGIGNTSSGHGASVSGGSANSAGELGSSVSGGINNTAGEFNFTDPSEPGQYSSIAGGSNNTVYAKEAAILGGSGNLIDTYTARNTIIGGRDVICSEGPSSFDICGGTMLQVDLLYGDISDSAISESAISDSSFSGYSVGASRFQLTPLPDLSTSSTGKMYVDDSNALCVYLDDAWIKIAGSGICE